MPSWRRPNDSGGRSAAPTQAEVMAEKDRIVHDPVFGRSEVRRELLTAIVEDSPNMRESPMRGATSIASIEESVHQQTAVQSPPKASASHPEPKSVTAPSKTAESAPSSKLELIKTLAAIGALILSILALAWSIYSFQVQEKRLQTQIEIQQAMLEHQRQMDASKTLIELMPKIGCKDDSQRRIALELLKTEAPGRLRMILPIIEKCPATTAETARKIEVLKEQAANSEIESAFGFTVGNGRQYLRNGLAGSAARTFDSAADSLPKTYIKNGVLDLDEVDNARKAFAEGHFSVAADLFSKAYRKVPAATAFDSSAFRREPAWNITHSENKGDAK